MSIELVVNYDDDGNFTLSDGNKIEVVGAPDNIARLKKSPELATFLSTLQLAGGDAEVSIDSVTATILDAGDGSVTIVDSSAEIRPPTSDAFTAITWPLSEAGDPDDEGTIRLVITPQFTAAPGTNQTFVTLNQASGNKNAVKLRMTTTGNLVFEVFNNVGSGTIVVQIVATVLTFVTGTAVEIEANWDIINGVSQLFVDGVQVGTTNAGTGTRVPTSIVETRSGTWTNPLGERPNFDLEGIALFATPQHTANYTPTGVNLYAIDAPNVVPNTTIMTDGLLSLAQTVSEPDATEVRWTIDVGGLERWFDGAAWTTSDATPDQSNTLDEINTNLPTLDISAGTVIRMRAILVNPGVTVGTAGFEKNGDLTPTIAQHVLVYDFFAIPGDLVVCTVFGNTTAPGDTPIEGVPVRILVEPFIHGDHQIDRSELTTVSDATGAWEISIIETASIAAFPYTFVIGSVSYPDRQVPSQATQKFELLAVGS